MTRITKITNTGVMDQFITHAKNLCRMRNRKSDCFNVNKESKMLKRKIGYNIKKAILPIIGGALLFGATSCEKEDPYKAAKEVCAAKYHVDSVYTWNDNLKKCVGTFIGDPNQAKIEELTAKCDSLKNDVRIASPIAREGIEGFFDLTFKFAAQEELGQDFANNFEDSVRTHVRQEVVMRREAQMGANDPFPVNDAELKRLYNGSNAYVVTAAELAQLQGQKIAHADVKNIQNKAEFDNNLSKQYAMAKNVKNTKMAYVARTI